jgi:anti-anti-sigma factor
VADQDLLIQRDEAGDVVTFTVAGEIDLVNSVALNRALDAELDRLVPPREIHADLSAVGFMDTSGVAMLLHARSRAIKRGSHFVVTSASPFLDRLFEITGIAPLIR